MLWVLVIPGLIAGCATMQSRWAATESADTITAYEDFLNKYPEGDLANQARARLKELYEQRDWKEAEAQNTISAYEDFLKRYTLGILADDARLRIEKLDFEQAQAKDTISAYDGFLQRYPQGIFADEARSRREKLYVIRSASEWGAIMYPKSNTNIRAKRSAASKLKGQLKAGRPVKVDFLQGAWYAVFQVTAKQQNEKMALGYVYAPLLIDKSESNFPGSTDYEEKSAKNTPLKEIETENLSVDVKNITFKIAEDGKELLFIEFNRYYLPVFSGIQGKAPKIILEITNASSLRNDWAVINTGGKLIRKINSSMNFKTHAARIVLDMEPSKDYFIKPVFYEKENTYSLEISEEKKIRLP